MNPRLYDHKQRVIKMVNNFIDQVDGYTANYGIDSETLEFIREIVMDLNACKGRILSIYVERGVFE